MDSTTEPLWDPDATGPGRDFVTGEPTIDELLLRKELRQRMFGAHDERVLIDRYTVLEKLGEGGMAIVYRARDEELGREVAVKVLVARAEAARDRVQREARAMARLSHPNVVVVHEVGSVDDQVYVVMELVPGLTLRRWLESTRTWDERLDVFTQAARGLAAAHDGGVVHRDFKPENVIVGDDGRVRVLDFGLATTEGEASEGSTRGTPAYMAPEQRVGGSVDARSDQFSFCVALWEGLFGSRPSLDAAPPLPPEGRGSPRLRAALRRGLANDPEARNDSMKALVELLEREQDPQPVAAMAVPTVVAEPAPKTPGRQTMAAVAVAVGMLMAGANVLLLSPASTSSRIPWVLVAIVVFAVIALLPAVLNLRKARG